MYEKGVTFAYFSPDFSLLILSLLGKKRCDAHINIVRIPMHEKILHKLLEGIGSWMQSARRLVLSVTVMGAIQFHALLDRILVSTDAWVPAG